tara:strand:- start:642 stop:782 length:141 start_codon:yes stop_codon:yes gene_type:complete
MGTKAKDVIVNNDMLKEFEEKLSKLTTDNEKNNLSKEYYTKIFTIK